MKIQATLLSYHVWNALWMIPSAQAQTPTPPPTSPVPQPSSQPNTTVNSTSTAAPVTAAPVTAAPVTAAPATAAPATAAPGTAAPVTVAPVTAAPVTVAPATAAPVTVAPATAAPATVAPVVAAPVTAGPATAQPVSMAPECSAYAACAGLVDDCCPTVDNVFLYCCFESETPGGLGEYKNEFTLVNSATSPEMQKAEYFVSTSTYFNPGTAPDGRAPVISYVRDPLELYDMIYYKTAAITNANDYVSGDKKFYMDVYSSAPPCTQIIVQLDSLPLAKPDNYPTGRHSRYFAATTVKNAWERLQFDFLDRPDPDVANDEVNAIALFFSPGIKSADPFYFENFDSAVIGCTSDCEQSSPKSCSALFEGETGACADGVDNDADGLIDCQDPECTNDPACSSSVQVAYEKLAEQSQAGSGATTVHRGATALLVVFMAAATLL